MTASRSIRRGLHPPHSRAVVRVTKRALVVAHRLVLPLACVVYASVCLEAHAHAQAAERLERRLFRPGSSAAGSPGSAGWLGNPATAIGVRAVSLGWLGTLGGAARDRDRGAGWALHGGVPLGPLQLGFALEHLVDPAPLADASPGLVPNRLTLGGAVRADGWLDVGLALRWTTDVLRTVSPLMTLDLGMRVAPFSWLTLGVHVSDLLGGTLYRYPSPANTDAGVGIAVPGASAFALAGPQVTTALMVRLLDARLRLRMDMRWPNGQDIDSLRASGSWQLLNGHHIGLLVESRSLHAADAPSKRLVSESDWRFGVYFRTGSRPTTAQRRGTTRSPHRLRMNLAVGAAGADDTAGWAAGGVTWLHVGPRTPWSALARRIGRRRRQQAPTHLLDLAARQQRGWQSPLVGEEQAAAAAVARSYLAVSRALAKEDSAGICASFAAQVRLDVDAHAPDLSVHQSTTKAVACAQLQQPTSPWSRYRHALGPAPVHADAPRYVGGLFAMHGSPYEWIPLKQEAAYRLAMKRRTAATQCHTWRVLPVKTLKRGRRVVDVVVLCDDQRDFIMQFVGDTQHGYLLQHLLLERAASASPSPAVVK